MPDAGIVPSAQADGKVRQLAGGTSTRAASLPHRCMAVGSLGTRRPPRSLATRTVGSRLPSRPRPMGTARRPRAVTAHSKSCRCRDSEASRVPAWVRSVLREGPCGGLAPIAPANHRPPSGGGAGTPLRRIRGAARPPQPPDCHVRGLSEVWVRAVLREGPCGGLAPIAPANHRPPSGGGADTPFRPFRGAAAACQWHAAADRAVAAAPPGYEEPACASKPESEARPGPGGPMPPPAAS